MRLVYSSILIRNCQELFLTFSCVFPENLLYYPNSKVRKSFSFASPSSGGPAPVKTAYWIVILVLIFALSLAAFFLFSPGENVTKAQIYSDGQVIRTVDLLVDQEFTVTDSEGTNTVTVRDGKIAVTQADCPDGYCVDRGFCNSGTQIVCLPHSLVITFLGETEVDFVVG